MTDAQTTARRDFFAAHAPMPPPAYFPRLGNYVDCGLAQYEMAAPFERDIRWVWLETQEQHEVRWRWHYAQRMLEGGEK